MKQPTKSYTIPTTEPVYTLGTTSKLSAISVYSIRQYIDNGLILPYVTNTNRHLFSFVDILRLKCIKKQLSENGLNIAGIKAMYSLIPCWAIHPCSIESRQSCDAYYSMEVPCWDASEKGPECKNKDCRNCEVYKFPEECGDLKGLVRKYVIDKDNSI